MVKWEEIGNNNQMGWRSLGDSIVWMKKYWNFGGYNNVDGWMDRLMKSGKNEK